MERNTTVRSNCQTKINTWFQIFLKKEKAPTKPTIAYYFTHFPCV